MSLGEDQPKISRGTVGAFAAQKDRSHSMAPVCTWRAGDDQMVPDRNSGIVGGEAETDVIEAGPKHSEDHASVETLKRGREQ